MTPTPRARSVGDSVVQMTEIVLPEDTNPRGSVFGGRVLALIDKCAAAVGLRHSRSDVLTASLDSVVFLNRVRLGELLLLQGRLNAAFGSSMEVEVEVHAEDPYSGARTLTTTAYVTIVAVDARGRPCPVPELELATVEERQRAADAAERRARRLASRR